MENLCEEGEAIISDKDKVNAKVTNRKKRERKGEFEEFVTAYKILEEAVNFQEKRKGYLKLYGKIAQGGKPPCNFNYLKYKIALDRYLSKTTYKIYKVLDLI